MAGKPLLKKKDRAKMQELFAVYIQDENNLKDRDGRYRTYHQISRDLKGLITPWIIKAMLKEINPELVKALSTQKKQHHSRLM